MTMAAAIESRTAEAAARSKPGRIARIESRTISRQAGAVWRGLEDGSQFSTPYQRFDFLSSWQRQVGTAKAFSRSSSIGYDSEQRPLLLLPLALEAQHGVRAASFMGGKHATFNMALWDRDYAGNGKVADLDALIVSPPARSEADVLALRATAVALVRLADPLAHAAARDFGQRLSAADDGAGGRARDIDQQLVPPPAQGQGAQAAYAARLPLPRRHRRRRRRSGCSTGSSSSSRSGWRSRSCPTCSRKPASRTSSAAPA